MKEKIKKFLKNFRIIVLIVAVILAIVAIHPRLQTNGVVIKNVLTNSSASLAGIVKSKGLSNEIILSINNKQIRNVDDYYGIISTLSQNQTVQIKTNKAIYRIIPKEKISNATELGLRVGDVPKTNIKKGLDLQGGTRVLLQPEERLAQEDINSLIDNIKERLNTYGLSDIVVRGSGDLSGNQYILVEIAGATEDDVRELLAKQGKFEAKISNATVFVGGRDITYVCRSAECSGIDPSSPCRQFNGGWSCSFSFSITLTQEAAERQADATKNLVVTDNYLSEKLYLYLDDKQVDELNVGAELKGKAVTQISISGPGIGSTQESAFNNALDNMKRLQTILITGSLPVKLNVIKIDNISSVLGKEFISNALLVGLIVVLSVVGVIYFSYRKFVIVIPIAITIISELIILLGVASLIGWNIDLAAIAGIIIAVGTGVDHQIVITDEALRGGGRIYNWRERYKNAFFIIMGTFFTVVFAMIPLLFAGAGLLKGFALTTIIGVSLGVFITRPAYSSMIEILLGD